MKQYEHLKNLKKISPSPFQIAKNRLKGNNYNPSYKKEIKEQNIPCDHRTVLSNEIIFELDAKGWPYNYKISKQLIHTLEEMSIPHYIYATGGKGVHISCYFNELKFNKEQKNVFRKALEYGFSWKHVRQWFIKEIVEYSGINTDVIGMGKGKIIDLTPMSFNELYDGTHLIRCCGGRKQKYDKDSMSTDTHYKTYIPSKEYKKTKITVTNYENVQYPEIIKRFNINVDDLMIYVNAFINKAEEDNTERFEEIKLEEGYTNLSCVQNVVQGMPNGERSIGAQIISSALVVDNRDDYKEVLQEYVNNCDQTTETFNMNEALNWYYWTKNQPVNFVNHNHVKSFGVCDGNCAYEKAFKKDSYKILERSDVLDRIDKYLSNVIAGEKKNRILIFLLLVSSKFDIKKKSKGIMNHTSPQSIILSSSSSSGKTWVTKSILKLFGKEDKDYLIFSRMTASVLNYFQDMDMTNKVLFVEELQGLDSSSNQLRLWISEGTLQLAGVEKVKDEDGIEKNALVIKKNVGQPCFITGTAQDEVDEQMNNRSWIISMDVSKEQNKRVLDFEDKIARGEIKLDHVELRILQDAIKEINNYDVIIPFLSHEDLGMPIEDTRVRRDYNKLKTLISCSALLHQRQREIIEDEEGNKHLIANLEDYDIARKYSMDILESAFLGLTNQQLELYQKIKASTWNLEFAISDVQKMTGYSYGKCHSLTKQLEEVGAILSNGREMGKQVIFSINPNKNFGQITLPTMYELADIIAKKSLPIKKNGVFLTENGYFSNLKTVSEWWLNEAKSEKKSRKFLIGSPKQRIIKTLETGDTSSLPEELDFILTSQKSNLFQAYRFRAKTTPKTEKANFTPVLLPEANNLIACDYNKILSELPKNKSITSIELEDLGITTKLQEKLITEGVLMKWKNGEVIVL